MRARGANGSRLQFRRDFASGRWEMRWGRRKQSGPIDSPAFLMGCRGGWRPAVIAVGCVSESPRSRLGPSATSTPYAFVSRVDFTCVSPRSAPTPTRNLGVLSRRVVVGPSFSVRATRNGRRLFGSELTLRCVGSVCYRSFRRAGISSRPVPMLSVLEGFAGCVEWKLTRS